MTKTERKKIARAALDKLGIDYPKSGKGSGAAALERLISNYAKAHPTIKKVVEGQPVSAEEVGTYLTDEAAWPHPWWVADHAEETRGTAPPKRVLHYGPEQPKHPPEGGGRWKKRKKPPKWLGDVGKATLFAAKLIAKIIL